jgi:hypothetical protein
MKNKTKRPHPLSALDPHSGPSSNAEAVSAEDQRIDCSATTPYGKCCERYSGNVTKQLEAFEECNYRKRRTQKYLNHLEREIQQGYINGLEELAFLAHSATQLLEQLAKRSPNYVSIVAQKYGSWPTSCMLNTPDKGQRELLQSIKLDHANIDGLPAHIVGPGPNPTRAWAFRLIKALQDYRRPATKDDLPRELFRSFVIVGGSSTAEAIPQLKDYPAICGECLKLPPFGINTEARWWKLAHDLLLRISNNQPWTLEGLSEVAKPGKVKNAEAGGQKADGLKRDAVLKTLRSAFKTLARLKDKQRVPNRGQSVQL